MTCPNTVDPLLRVLYPHAKDPDFTHAHKAAVDRCNLRAEVLKTLHPGKTFRATYLVDDDGVTHYEVLHEEEPGSGLEVFETTETLEAPK